MTEGERVRKLRKELGLTLDKFGQHLGITKVAVSMIESGKNNLSNMACKLISREFNIREEWLRTGEEPMYKTETTSERLAKESGLGEKFGKVIEMYNKLPPDVRHEVINIGISICETFAEELRKNGMLSKEEPEPEANPVATVEERDQWGCTAEDYHRVQSTEDEMKLEKEKREKSGA